MITNSVEVPENEVKPFNYQQENGIVGLMDCGGSNLVKINEQIPGIVKLIATSRINHPEVKAREKAVLLEVSLVEFDFDDHEKEQGVNPGDYLDVTTGLSSSKTEKIIQVRKDVCDKFQDLLYQEMDNEKISKTLPIFAAGFMKILSEEFVNNNYILNVHPGDLTKFNIKNELFRDKKIITGDAWKPSAKAISAGHEILYSSMHKMTAELDAGPVHMRGYGLPVDYNFLLSRIDINNRKMLKAVGSAAQETLKHLGDHVIAGATFQDIFDGNWGQHEKGLAYKYKENWYLAPNGIRIEDHITNTRDSPFERTPAFVDEKINEFYDKVIEISKR